MAAISTLMINDNTLRKEVHDEERTPTSPRGPPGSITPRAHETVTLSSQPSVSVISSSPQAEKRGPPPSESNKSQDEVEDTAPSDQRPSDAMDMDTGQEDLDDSDAETEIGEAGGSSRKKKGQRFFCTGYPPCNLSFTRSEHLARHIRKHTGERPFQCHCNRRFSRLDNLRQHAQTVHVNEEIPTDSLAATGTRYQRQIRTDRVRPTNRPRTGTMSSTGSHSRGHSRNLSTSSIGSTSSNYSISTDARRRPPPLLMAGEAGNRPSTPPSQYSAYAAHSPGELSTPTSATFSAAPGSPGFGPNTGSPISTNSRPAGMYGGVRTPGRRLSVPSSSNPYQSPYGAPYGSPYSSQANGPGPAVSSNSSTVTSPTSSSFAYSGNQYVPPGEDWRRRTWHPSTYSNLNLNYSRPATSGLTYSQTPDAPQPAFAQNATAAAGQAPRLPGIESFDHVQNRPSTPPRRNPSPMHVDQNRQVPLMSAPDVEGFRRGLNPWDGPRSSQYPELEDPANRSARSWGQQTIEQISHVARAHPETRTMAPPPTNQNSYNQQQIAQEALHAQSANKRTKRTGWYNGPLPPARTSPEDSSSSDGIPTPSTSTAEVHPAIVNSNGYLEQQHGIMPGETHHNVSRLNGATSAQR